MSICQLKIVCQFFTRVRARVKICIFLFILSESLELKNSRSVFWLETVENWQRKPTKKLGIHLHGNRQTEKLTNLG